MDASRFEPTEAQRVPLAQSATCLRIYLEVGERDRLNPLYESIVLRARKMRLGGATVVRGLLGYGRSRNLHSQKILELTHNVPVVIEIVDTPEKIEAFLPILDEIMTNGIVTMTDVYAIRHGAAAHKSN